MHIATCGFHLLMMMMMIKAFHDIHAGSQASPSLNRGALRPKYAGWCAWRKQSYSTAISWLHGQGLSSLENPSKQELPSVPGLDALEEPVLIFSLDHRRLIFTSILATDASGLLEEK